LLGVAVQVYFLILVILITEVEQGGAIQRAMMSHRDFVRPLAGRMNQGFMRYSEMDEKYLKWQEELLCLLSSWTIKYERGFRVG
jgi:hypothetical protein